MDTFFPITYSRLAPDALLAEVMPDYDVGKAVECRLLCAGLNDSYFVRTARGQFILRAYRPGWRSLPEIQYEIDVLSHLHAKGVPVSAPLRSRDGGFTRAVRAPEGGRQVALFTFACGKAVDHRIEEQTALYAGMMARIHSATGDFASACPRPLDIDHLLDQPLKCIEPFLKNRAADWTYLRELVDQLRCRLTALPLHALEQGFCHGDFHGGNAHISEDHTVTFFDFDCCGFGWRAYDIAVFRWAAGREDKRWALFLKSYTEHRKLNELDLDAVPLFVAIRDIWLLGLYTQNADYIGLNWASARLDGTLKFLRDWEAKHLTQKEIHATSLGKLIPRELLFGNPERTNPQISPDGKLLAYIAPDSKNVLQVWMRTLGQQDDRVLTADKKRGIRWYFWAFDGEQLIYLQDADGDENWHLYGISLKSAVIRDLTPFQGIQARLVACDSNFPDEILVGMNLKDRRTHDVYRVNIKNGAVELDTENPGNVVGWVADAEFTVRAAMATTSEGGSDLMVREAVDQPWRIVRHWGPEDTGSARSFSKDGKTLYITGSHDANTVRFLVLDLATGCETVLAEDPEYDVGGLFIHPIKRVIQAVGFYREKHEWRVLDPEIAPDFDALARVRGGNFGSITRDLADTTWIVGYSSDDAPGHYHTYARSSKTSTSLFSQQPKLEGLPLARMEPVSFLARDGLTIHGYLTIPVNVSARNLPTVLHVHGGPWGRDGWGFHSEVQWLSNRGYAVLQVNFRGSTGYGKKFMNAGNREWAGKMHDDLIDGVTWIVKEGIADPRKVAIMGGSYGGYATLVGLTFTPDVFAAGVDIVGPSNLATLLRSIPPYWGPMMAMFSHRVGNLDKEEDFLKSRSPLYFIDRIKAPLLIGQGANDSRVKQAESEQIVEAMRKANKPVEYILYTDEGHGFARPQNRLHFYAKAEEFLAKYLGGRCEPIGDIPGHSGVMK
ncbi:MAG: prolyl oligopeptidase family serine peptidase [Verrucomicrobia bacterium]|nr:prolyl oligopeptidase family serine peptidase [Verrucomicrobiota bacterium]